MSDFEKFCKEVLGITLTKYQLDLAKAHAQALADGKRLVVIRHRAAGQTTLMRALGQFMSRSLTDMDSFELPKTNVVYKDKF